MASEMRESEMQKLDRATLWGLEQYAEERSAFRTEVMAHKKPRRIAIGKHATLYFEDFLTMKYQVQEMLRVERIFEAAAIEEEIATYNPLIPDGSNLKATFMIEYEDVVERAAALGVLGGVENTVYLEVTGCERVYAIANEDLERTRGTKAAAVHFLRFELDASTVAASKAGQALKFGIEHPALAGSVTLDEAQRLSLLQDLA